MFEFLSAIFSKLLFFVLHITGAHSFPRPLKAAEEREAIARMKEGDAAARAKLIEHNLRLVAHVVKKYYADGIEQDDLISIGTIGLIKAVDTFDEKKGIRLSSYAARCIENEILMHFRARKKTAQDISLNEAIDTDKDGNVLTLLDTLACEEDLAETIEAKLSSDALRKVIDRVLSPRERTIILLRYGLYGGRPLAQREVAQTLGISRSYVSRIEKRAIETLREAMNSG